VGFDVMMDEQLKMWLFEVNASPSFSADADIDVRWDLVFNLAQRS
jgi:D-alanine-D-alanine ligase-like ATP-grasp enzyme